MQKLLHGLARSTPDLLLLQEVQGTTLPNKDDHFTDLKDSLADLGYQVGAYGRLSDKVGCELGTDAKSKSKKKPHIGNAIFFQSEVWERLDRGRICFAHVLAERCQGNPAQSEHYSNGQQIAVWARLLHIPTERTVVAVSVHIGANWRNPDTQIAQIDALLSQLKTIVQEGDTLMLGGDFNSQPTGGAYEYLSKGSLSADHPDVLPKDANVQKLCGDSGYQTCFNLGSAYAALCGSEPHFTTKEGIAPNSPLDYTFVPFSGTLDYLWYSTETLQPVPGTSLQMPYSAEVSEGFPNAEIPSDHLPLGLALSFLPIVNDEATWNFLESGANELDDWNVVEPAHAADVGAPPVGPASNDEIPCEIAVEIERIKAACEAELQRHLSEWLSQVGRAQPTYQDWIADVHPENVREIEGVKVIDARLYLADSFHRLLWNQHVALTEGLDAEERERRYVPTVRVSREPDSDGSSGSKGGGHPMATAAALALAPPLAAAGFATGSVATGLLAVPFLATPLIAMASRRREVAAATVC
jgi:mRNA deadenylase 3'-5' endonuclease subunit Ccr4